MYIPYNISKYIIYYFFRFSSLPSIVYTVGKRSGARKGSFVKKVEYFRKKLEYCCQKEAIKAKTV